MAQTQNEKANAIIEYIDSRLEELRVRMEEPGSHQGLYLAQMRAEAAETLAAVFSEP